MRSASFDGHPGDADKVEAERTKLGVDASDHALGSDRDGTARPKGTLGRTGYQLRSCDGQRGLTNSFSWSYSVRPSEVVPCA
jgi:hypothetical protein